MRWRIIVVGSGYLALLRDGQVVAAGNDFASLCSLVANYHQLVAA